MKMTSIIINGEPFVYNDEVADITYDNIKPITREEAHSLLEQTKLLFDKNNIFFFLAYGTLLGAVREKDLIHGDEDVDVFTDDENKLRIALPDLQRNGLKLCRILNGYLYSFKNGSNAYIDVYVLKKTPLGLWYKWCLQIGGSYYPKFYFSKFDTISFLGGDYLIPHKPERLLKLWYGKTWNIPISGHNPNSCHELIFHYWWLRKIYIPVHNYCFFILRNLKKMYKFISQ